MYSYMCVQITVLPVQEWRHFVGVVLAGCLFPQKNVHCLAYFPLCWDFYHITHTVIAQYIVYMFVLRAPYQLQMQLMLTRFHECVQYICVNITRLQGSIALLPATHTWTTCDISLYTWNTMSCVCPYQEYWKHVVHIHVHVSLVPMPHPAFECCMQKSGRATYNNIHVYYIQEFTVSTSRGDIDQALLLFCVQYWNSGCGLGTRLQCMCMYFHNTMHLGFFACHCP